MRKLLLFSLPFALGALLCQYLLPGLWPIAAVLPVLAAGFAITRFVRRRYRRPVRIAAAGLAAGMLWFAGYAAVFLSPAEALAGTESTVRIELLDYAVETSGGARCTVRVLDQGLRGKAVYYGSARLLRWQPGDRVRTESTFYSASHLAGGDSAYFTAQGIFARLYGEKETLVTGGRAGSLRYLPQRLSRSLQSTAAAIYEPDAAGFITALLTGQRDGLDIRDSSSLSEAGLMHITAVSGLHCGFLILALGLLVFRRPRLMAGLGYPALLLYMLLAGCTPSVVRACVMTGFALLAPLLGREADPLTSLSGALLVILLANPFAIASVSLQLSFAAVAGLVLVSPRVYGAMAPYRARFRWMPHGVWKFAAGTAAASCGVLVLTAPLNALYFGSLPLVSPVANLLVLWMMPALFASALAVTALCGPLPALAPLAAVPEWMAHYVLRTAEALAKLPGHSVYFTGPAAVLWLALVYGMLLVCLLSKERRRKYIVAAVSAGVCLLAAKSFPLAGMGSGELTAVAVNVGQGAATLLHAGDCTVLVDCGSLGGAREPGEAVAAAMGTYGWRSLDYVALTHYHEDHAGGLSGLLARVEVGQMLLPRLPGGSQAELQGETLALAEAYGIPVSYVEERTRLELGPARLTVYPPVSSGDANEEGLSFLCTSGYFDLLITGDMAAETERRLLDAYRLPDIEVLLVGHHGSQYATSRELLEAVRPEVGVISVGAGNRFGHPAAEALDRMEEAGMALFRTDLNGNILIQVHERG